MDFIDWIAAGDWCQAAESFFVDRTLAARWAEYHREHARLRVIHPGENLVQAK
jgi:hypothetical protein